MPIYEFRCRDCRRKTTALVLARARLGEVRCDACGSANLDRLWSRFATVRSEEARLDALEGSSGQAGVDEDDPKSMMRWMKRMSQETGEDLGPDVEQAFEEEMARGSSGGKDDTGGTGGAGDEGDDLG